MHATGMSPVAVTSARSTRHRMVRRNATTTTTRTLLLGPIAGQMRRPSSTRNPWSSTTFTRARGVTSNETDTEDLAAEEQQREGRIRPLRDGRCGPGDVDAGVYRRAERDADPA